MFLLFLFLIHLVFLNILLLESPSEALPFLFAIPLHPLALCVLFFCIHIHKLYWIFLFTMSCYFVFMPTSGVILWNSKHLNILFLYSHFSFSMGKTF